MPSQAKLHSNYIPINQLNMRSVLTNYHYAAMPCYVSKHSTLIARKNITNNPGMRRVSQTLSSLSPRHWDPCSSVLCLCQVLLPQQRAPHYHHCPLSGNLGCHIIPLTASLTSLNVQCSTQLYTPYTSNTLIYCIYFICLYTWNTLHTLYTLYHKYIKYIIPFPHYIHTTDCLYITRGSP